MQLVRTNHSLMHSVDHADLELCIIRGLDRKGADFIDSKQTHSLTHTQTLNFVY